MKSKKTVRKALWMSVLSIALCLTMLVGTTFAWFTDTASTAVNKIQAGNLKIGLEKKVVGENGTVSWVDVNKQTLDFVKAAGHESEEILWEPGCTYELPQLRVVNKGNLAVKFKVAVTGIQGDTGLGKVIDWTINGLALDTDLTLAPKAENATEYPSQVFTISAHMQESAGNEYQKQSIENIAITVLATQAAYEYDSFDKIYDANAQYPVYPAGITKDSFTEGKQAVDANGNFYTSFADAMASVADGGTLYFKEDSVVDFPTHLNVTKSITIKGNGADFSGRDISIGTYEAPVNGEATINIYNTKNLVVWGQPVGDRADVWNVNFYNCENNGYNFLMYRSETGKATINLTMTNCKSNGFKDSIVHTTADGSIVIQDCTFTNNCAPVNIAHKQAGTMTVKVKDSTFVNCGKVDRENDYFAPARFVNNNEHGTLDITLKGNTFTGTIGTNGDILLGDYRTGKASHALTATITTDSPVMVKSSAGAAYSCNGGTITLN